MFERSQQFSLVLALPTPQLCSCSASLLAVSAYGQDVRVVKQPIACAQTLYVLAISATPSTALNKQINKVVLHPTPTLLSLPGVRQQQQQLNQQLQQQHRNGLQQHQVPHTRKLAAAAGSRLTIEHQLKTVWSSSSWHQLPPLLPSLSCWRALHTTPAAAQQTAAASAPSQQQQQQEQQLLPPEIVSACEGPALLYRQGLESGMYRPDPLQQVTVQKLQVRVLVVCTCACVVEAAVHLVACVTSWHIVLLKACCVHDAVLCQHCDVVALSRVLSCHCCCCWCRPPTYAYNRVCLRRCVLCTPRPASRVV